jgi:hypothetical protein
LHEPLGVELVLALELLTRDETDRSTKVGALTELLAVVPGE